MSLLRFAASALLPRVFVAGSRRDSAPTPVLITARDLRAAVAANAALITFAGADEATRALAGDDPFAAPAAPAAAARSAGATPAAAAAMPPAAAATSAGASPAAAASPPAASPAAAAASPPAASPGAAPDDPLSPGRELAA